MAISRNKYVLLGFALLVAAAAAVGVRALSTGSAHATPSADPAAPSTADAAFAVLRRARTADDDLPAAATKADASQNYGNARRLDVPGSRYDAWLVPGTEDANLAASQGAAGGTSQYCVRVTVASGAQAGIGGAGCAPAATFANQGVWATVGGGADGAPGFAAHEVVVAGVVPDRVSQVIVGLADGSSQTQTITQNGFLFDTTATVARIGFVTDGQTDWHPLGGCQDCG